MLREKKTIHLYTVLFLVPPFKSESLTITKLIRTDVITEAGGCVTAARFRQSNPKASSHYS